MVARTSPTCSPRHDRSFVAGATLIIFLCETVLSTATLAGFANGQLNSSAVEWHQSAELVANILRLAHNQAQKGAKLRSSYDYSCRLLIKGHAAVSSSMQLADPAAAAGTHPSHPLPQDKGVAVAQLNCSTWHETKHATVLSTISTNSAVTSPINTTAGQAKSGPTVVFNSTHLAQHATSFQGVQLVNSSDGSRVLKLCGSIGEPPVFPLLAFCGNYSVLFEHLLVEGLRLPISTSIVSKGSESTWDAAVLLFGGSVEAAVLGGVIHNTVAGTPIEVGEQASLLLSNTSITANTGAAWGGALCASTQCTVNIANGSVIAGNLAGHGGGVYAMGDARVVITDSDCSNNTAVVEGGCVSAHGDSIYTLDSVTMHGNAVYENTSSPNATTEGHLGAAIRAVGGSRVLMQSCSIAHSTALDYCGAAGLAGEAVILMGNSTVFNCTAREGGAFCATDSSQLLLYNSSIMANKATAYGGAFDVEMNSTIVMWNSTCDSNVAADKGGCLYATDSAHVNVSSDSNITSNTAVAGAGAWVQGESVLHVWGQILTCKAVGNIVGAGYIAGGIRAVGNSTVVLHLGSKVAGCKSYNCGGVAAAEQAIISLNGAVLYNNSAYSAGGLCVSGNATVHVDNCSCIAGNVADEDGGGVYAEYDTTVLLRGCSSLVGNYAGAKGGGLAVYNRALLLVDTGNSNSSCAVQCGPKPVCGDYFDTLLQTGALQSSAATMEAALGMGASASPTVDKSAGTNASAASAAAPPTASVGVANVSQEVVAAVSEAMLQARGPCIVGNAAGTRGGGMNWNAGMQGAQLVGNATPANALINNALVMLNSAGVGGGGLTISGADGAVVQLTNVTVANCEASWGGGMYVEQTAVCLGYTTIANNTAVGIRSYGGGVCVSQDTGVLNLTDHSAVTANTAQFYGGGIEAEYGAAVNILGAATVSNNSAQQGGGIAFVNWHGNYSTYAQTALHDNIASTSPDLLLPPTSVSVVSAGNSSHVGEQTVVQVSSRLARNEGLLPVAVMVSGYQEYPVEGALVSARLNETEELSGGFKKTNASGIADFWDLKLRQRPGLYNVSFQVLDWLITLPPAHLQVLVRSCVPGEVTLGLPDVCEPCVNGSYSFSPANASCDACPAGAVCEGATVLPLPSWWHSAKDSPQMHKCPNPAACTGVPPESSTCNTTTTDGSTGGSDAATSGSSNSEGGSSRCQGSSNGAPLANGTITEISEGCSAGYTGHLCGECMPGWGMTKLFTCRRCLPSTTIVALYVSACVVMLLVVKLIAHFTVLENMKASGHSSGSSVSGSSAAAVLGPADVLKSLVLYSQYLTIIASMPVDWPPVISIPMQALQWFWSSASSQTLSLECVLRGIATALPVAIQRVLVYLGTPILIYVLLVLLSVAARALRACAVVFCSNCSHGSHGSTVACRSNLPAFGCLCGLHSSRRFPLSHTCGVMGLAMVFVFLPTLSRAAFSLFVCINIDDPYYAPYAYTAAANGSWWVYDLNAQCMAGYHRAWALGLGLPLAIALCFVLPIGIAALTCLNRRRLHDPVFCSKFGFLVSSYKPNRCVWEAVVVLQTIALVAVAVFGFTLGVYNQALVLNCTFSLIVVLLLIFKPYRCEQLYRLRLVGTGVLLLTSYAAQSFLSVSLSGNSADAYKVAMGVLVLVVNAAYVLWGVALLLQHLQWRPVRQLIRKISLKHHLLQQRLKLGGVSNHTRSTDQHDGCLYCCKHADASMPHHAGDAKACTDPALLPAASATSSAAMLPSGAACDQPGTGLMHTNVPGGGPVLNGMWCIAMQRPPPERQNGPWDMA